MIRLSKPNAAQVDAFLEKAKGTPFTYTAIGQSKQQAWVKGYNNDFNRILLGKGKQVFQAACEAIRTWQMFPGDWAWIEPVNTPIAKGQDLAMIAKVMGVYFVSDCRIVYLIDEQEPIRRYGFAYGTLERHIETGEELFSVEQLPDGSVWYVLRAFSKPRLWLARLGYPMARMYQKKFVHDSQQAMVKAVHKAVQMQQ